MKRAFDVVLALFALIVLSPVLLLAALAVQLVTNGVAAFVATF